MMEVKNIKAKGNTMVTILIIIFGALLVGAAAFGGYMLASKASNNSKADKTNTQNEVKNETVYSAGEFLVNLADANGKRYLKVNMSLAFDEENKALAEELQKKNDAVRDTIISVLRTKKVADLETATGPQELKKEITTRVNSLLSKGRLTNVYYKEFVIQ